MRVTPGGAPSVSVTDRARGEPERMTAGAVMVVATTSVAVTGPYLRCFAQSMGAKRGASLRAHACVARTRTAPLHAASARRAQRTHLSALLLATVQPDELCSGWRHRGGVSAPWMYATPPAAAELLVKTLPTMVTARLCASRKTPPLSCALRLCRRAGNRRS